MKLYAYCVTRAHIQRTAGTTGLFDRNVYSISVGEISALVSDVAEDPIVVTKHSVLTHQRVVSSLLDETTPLPFRFGTVVTEHELTSFLESRRPALLEKLAFVDGCVEMSVKIIWQEWAEEPSKDDRNQTGPSGSVGTEFLRKKSAELAGSQMLVDKANELAAWLKGCLGSTVSDIRMTVRPSQRLVIAADCLVPRVQLDSYRSAIDGAFSEKPDLHYFASGPWPPYSFANIDLEFKSHFGVS